MDKLVKWLENLLRAQKKSRAWRTFVSCLAAIVVFTTTYSLILPAITVEQSATEDVGGLVLDEADPGSTGAEAEATGEVVSVDAENETSNEFELNSSGGGTDSYRWTAVPNDNNTYYTFKITGLPAYSEGKELEYYVQEVPVADYQEPEYAMDPSASEDNDTEPEVKPNEADRAMNKEYVINRPINAVSLPSTGGPGTKLFYGMGISLMTFAGIFFFIKRRSIRNLSKGRW